MAQYLLVILCLLLIAIGLIFSRTFMRINITAYGLLFGVAYFLFFPLLVLLVQGHLDIPLWAQLGKTELLGNISINDQVNIFFILLLYICDIYVLFLLLYFNKTNRHYTETKAISNLGELKIYYSSIVLYFLLQIFLMLASGAWFGGNRYFSVETFQQEKGVLAQILTYVIWGFRLIVVSYTFNLLDKKQINNFIALLVVLSVSLFELRFVGNRITIIMFFITGIFYLFKKYGFIKLLPSTILIVPIAYIMAIYQDVRGLLFTKSITEIITYSIPLLNGADVKSRLLTIFEHIDTIVMLNLFSDVGKTITPLYGATFIRLLTWIIPRSLWLDKSLTVTSIVGSVYVPSTSIVPLIFGEFHYNFSLIGVLFFPILFFVYLIAKQIFSRQMPNRFYFDFIVGFLLVRYPIADMFISIFFAFVVQKILYVILKFRVRNLIKA